MVNGTLAANAIPNRKYINENMTFLIDLMLKVRSINTVTKSPICVFGSQVFSSYIDARGGKLSF